MIRDKAGGLREGWEAYCGFCDIVLRVNCQQELFFNVVNDSSTFHPKGSALTLNFLNARAGGKGVLITQEQLAHQLVLCSASMLVSMSYMKRRALLLQALGQGIAGKAKENVWKKLGIDRYSLFGPCSFLYG